MALTISQEFVDARRRVVTLQNAPQVLFRNDPPLELENIPGLNSTGSGEISYVTFGNNSILLYSQVRSATDQVYSFVPSTFDSSAPL